MRNERELEMTNHFEEKWYRYRPRYLQLRELEMTYEEKWYRYLLRTDGSAAAIADALEKLNAVREKETKIEKEGK